MNNLNNTPKNLLRTIIASAGGSRYLSDYLYEKLKIHPAFPSFSSIHSILKEVCIDSIGIKTTSDTLLRDIPLPTVVHLNSNKQDVLAIVEKVINNDVYLRLGHKKVKMDKSTFDDSFTGEVLLIDYESACFDISLKDIRKFSLSILSKRLLPFVILIGVLFQYFFSSDRSISADLYLLTSLVGLYISISLFSHQLGVNNTLFESLCNQRNTFINCNKVLSSRASDLWGVLTLSEGGLIYFSTLIIGIVVIGYPSLSASVNILSFMSLPFTLFFILYQWIVLKKWCLLCMIVQAILIIQFSIALFGFHYEPMLLNHIIHLFLLGWICFLTVLVIKPYVEKSILYDRLNLSLTKIKHSPIIRYNTILKERMDLSKIITISLFSSSSKITIAYVFFPTCTPCIVKLNKLIAYIKKNNDINLQLIFHTYSGMASKDLDIITNMLFSYHTSRDSFVQEFEQYVVDFSNQKNTHFIHETPQNTFVKEIMSNHAQWCNDNNIHVTPTIFINGFYMPYFYEIEDLKFFIEDLLFFHQED